MALDDLLQMVRDIAGAMPEAIQGLDEFANRSDRIVDNAERMTVIGEKAQTLADKDTETLRTNLELAKQLNTEFKVQSRPERFPEADKPGRAGGAHARKGDSPGALGYNPGRQFPEIGGRYPEGSYYIPDGRGGPGSIGIPYEGGILIRPLGGGSGFGTTGMSTGGAGGGADLATVIADGVSQGVQQGMGQILGPSGEVVSTFGETSESESPMAVQASELGSKLDALTEEVRKSNERVSQVEVNKVSPGERQIVSELQSVQRSLQSLRPRDRQDPSVEFRAEGLV